jgi:hypothetical protein
MWGKQEVTKSRDKFASGPEASLLGAAAVTSAHARGIHALLLYSRKLSTPMGYLNADQK